MKYSGLLFVLLMVLVLAACGGDEIVGPELATLPFETGNTFTATPAAVSVADQGAAMARLDVVSLRDNVQAFLIGTETTEFMSWTDLFVREVIAPAGDCMTPDLWARLEPAQLFRWQAPRLPPDWRGSAYNSINLIEPWQTVTDEFREDAMLTQASQALDDAAALLPRDDGFLVCVMPALPAVFPGQDVDTVPNNGVSTVLLNTESLLLRCGMGEECLPAVPSQVAFGYALAYQLRGQPGLEVPLLHWIVHTGRAAAVVRDLYPTLAFPWSEGLTPEQVVTVTERVDDYAMATYRSDYRGNSEVAQVLFGNPDNVRYPLWGGLYLGDQIVQAYRAAHPDLSLVELMDVPPETLIEDSGYQP
jgi:hypothetical protein